MKALILFTMTVLAMADVAVADSAPATPAEKQGAVPAAPPQLEAGKKTPAPSANKVTSAPTRFTRIHFELNECPQEFTGYDLWFYLNSEIPKEAAAGLELTGANMISPGKCAYIYSRKRPIGKTSEVASSSDENYFETRNLPCSDDDALSLGWNWYGERLLKQINDANEDEAAKHFHLVSVFPSATKHNECLYFFVRDIKVQ